MKKMNKKGFTLAELLIVVAIIGVLTAVAIPIFSSQLEKSREATDLANIRDVYAELASGILVNGMDQNGATMKVLSGLTATTTATTGSFSIAVPGFPVQQKVANWQTSPRQVATISLADSNCPAIAATTPLVFTFTISGDTTYLSAIAFTNS